MNVLHVTIKKAESVIHFLPSLFQQGLFFTFTNNAGKKNTIKNNSENGRMLRRKELKLDSEKTLSDTGLWNAVHHDFKWCIVS